MLSREEAWRLVCEKIQGENLRKHMLATEAVMRALAVRLGRDEALYGIVGLVHDLDLEAVSQDMHRHAAVAVEWLEGKLPPEALSAIQAHNAEGLGLVRQGELAHALAAAETLTGLVVATTLVLPSKKLADLQPRSVLKRMKEPRFAAGANREVIRECEKIGLELSEFVALGVTAMRTVAGSLGL